MIIGSIITGYTADIFGRKKTIIFSGIIQFLTSLGFWKANSFFFLTLLRFLYGFCYGFSYPLAVSSMTEIVPL